MNLIYSKDGITINDTFISVHEILSNCTLSKIKEESLVLLKIEWPSSRMLHSGIYERIILPSEKAIQIKSFLINKEVYFGEIAGKHSEIYGTIEESEISIETNKQEVLNFLLSNPSGTDYNYSFIKTLINNSEGDDMDLLKSIL